MLAARSLAVLILCTTVAFAQDYPTKPIRVLASGPGGITDFAARLISQGLAGGLGQQVIVDNRPSGVIPMDIVAKSLADGYTLLVSGSSLWVTPLLQERLPYDALKDFAPISLTNSAPNLLLVHPSLPAKTVKELIAIAKSMPGALNYYSSGAGSSTHLATALFAYMTGINIVRVPFKVVAAGMTSLVGGEVQLAFTTAGTYGVTSFITTGRLRALAVTSAQPSPLFPDLPTVAASGVPGYEAVQMGGIFAPSRTPVEVIARLNQETVRFLKTKEARDRFASAGVEAIGSSPEYMLGLMKSEMARLGKVIKATGIKAE